MATCPTASLTEIFAGISHCWLNLGPDQNRYRQVKLKCQLPKGQAGICYFCRALQSWSTIIISLLYSQQTKSIQWVDYVSWYSFYIDQPWKDGKLSELWWKNGHTDIQPSLRSGIEPGTFGLGLYSTTAPTLQEEWWWVTWTMWCKKCEICCSAFITSMGQQHSGPLNWSWNTFDSPAPPQPSMNILCQAEKHVNYSMNTTVISSLL